MSSMEFYAKVSQLVGLLAYRLTTLPKIVHAKAVSFQRQRFPFSARSYRLAPSVTAQRQDASRFQNKLHWRHTHQQFEMPAKVRGTFITKFYRHSLHRAPGQEKLLRNR